MATQPRRLRQLLEVEALQLLGSVPLGRVVFTEGGLPTVRPVNHIVEDGHVVIRTHLGTTALGSTTTPGSTTAVGNAGSVVAYQADLIDNAEHTGWSVIVTGLAHLVHDDAQIRRYEELIHPWVSQQLTHVVRIQADVISGFELVADGADGSTSSAETAGA